MNKCRNCNIIVYDETDVCPLCHSVLDELEEEERAAFSGFSEKGAPYPDIRRRTRRVHFALRLILFLFIVAEVAMILINYFATPKMWWSAITGIAMVYFYASMIYWMHRDAGYAAKIGSQICLTIALLIGIDYFTGMYGWSLNWAVPGIVLFGDAIVFFLMMLNRQYWYSYTLLLLLIGILSVGMMALYFIGKIESLVLPILCVSVTGLYLLGTIVFGDREFTREMKRRFHI